MPSCEKCWSDAHTQYTVMTGTVADEYSRLITGRDETGHTCTPEQQAGEEAAECPECGRRAVHQWCKVCMACGYEEE